MRGLFTCGVLDVFMEQGITFDGAAGISAGAVFGCNYKSRQPGRALRYNKRYSRDPRYCSLWSLLTTGDLYGVEFCYHELPDKLDVFDRETFTRNPMAFYVGATDVETGEACFHLCKDGGADDIAWIRASASMPLASRPVEAGGRLLLDGGIADPVPYRYMEGLGYDRNVIVLTQPKGFVKKKSKAEPLLNRALHEYPAIVGAMAARHELYNRQLCEIGEREDAGSALVIRPPLSLGIHRTEKDPETLQSVYELGRAVAAQRVDDVVRFFSM